jgi:prevent-host-death family protein
VYSDERGWQTGRRRSHARLEEDPNPMKTVTIHEAKTNLSRLIEKACKGEEVIIARGSEPVARLLPLRDGKGRRQPGALKGKLRVGPEFFEPLPEEELRAWE